MRLLLCSFSRQGNGSKRSEIWQKQIDVYQYPGFPYSQIESLKFWLATSNHDSTSQLPLQLGVVTCLCSCHWNINERAVWQLQGTFLRRQLCSPCAHFLVLVCLSSFDRNAHMVSKTVDASWTWRRRHTSSRQCCLYSSLITKSRLLEEREIKSSLCHRYFGLESNPTLSSVSTLLKVTQLMSGRAGIPTLVGWARESTNAS